MTLREVLRQAKTGLPDTWLYLPGSNDRWTLATEAYLLDAEVKDGSYETFLPEWTAGLNLNLRDALDTQTVEDCVRWADNLAGREDDNIRFESFIYYVRNDAFLPEIGAQPPPVLSREESQRRADLQFYDELGAEDSSRPCKREGCSRGAVRFGIFCKPHHFEMLRRRVCPFDH